MFILLSVSAQADDDVASASAFDAIHDTEAFVAANDYVIMAVFRGSKGGRDWLTNLSILPRDIPREWNLDTEDGDLHRVGAYEIHCCPMLLPPIVSFFTFWDSERTRRQC